MPLSKAKEIRKLTDEEISSEIVEAKRQLFDLRLQKAMRRLEHPHLFKQTRHRLAQLLTIERERQLDAEEKRNLLMESFKKDKIEILGQVLFPEKVYIGEPSQLTILFQTPSEKLPEERQTFDTYVLVSPQYFELLSPEYQSLQLGQEPIKFKLVPKQKGKTMIGVDFFQKGGYLGNKKVTTKIMSKNLKNV